MLDVNIYNNIRERDFLAMPGLDLRPYTWGSTAVYNDDVKLRLMKYHTKYDLLHWMSYWTEKRKLMSPYSGIDEFEKLNYELKKLPGSKIIFTNGSKKHAETTILKLGIKDNFSGIFDIVDSDYIPKPDIAPYKKLISKYRINCSESIFFEDIAKNLLPAHKLGIKTAWIENDDKYCKEGFDRYHVDFRVKNLTKFLEDINKKVA